MNLGLECDICPMEHKSINVRYSFVPNTTCLSTVGFSFILLRLPRDCARTRTTSIASAVPYGTHSIPLSLRDRWFHFRGRQQPFLPARLDRSVEHVLETVLVGETQIQELLGREDYGVRRFHVSEPAFSSLGKYLMSVTIIQGWVLR